MNENIEHPPGIHLLIDLYDASNLTDIDYIKNTLTDAANICNANILEVNVHSFGEGEGVTGVAILSESHISIHTWPENNYAAIDIFLCGTNNPNLAIKLLEKSFNTTNIITKEIIRGKKT